MFWADFFLLDKTKRQRTSKNGKKELFQIQPNSTTPQTQGRGCKLFDTSQGKHNSFLLATETKHERNNNRRFLKS
jgi:hypothetical protein